MAFLYGTAAGDLLNGTADDDTLVGGAGSDTLNGGAGNDQLSGGSGWDLRGGDDPDNGIDILTGGAGADIFHAEHFVNDLTNPKINNLVIIDRITDFSAADGDRIALDMGGNIYSQRRLYLTWRGEVTSSNFSLTEGKTFGDVYQAGYAGVFTWTNGSVKYVIVDVDGNGVLNRYDFVMALDGAPQVDRYSFIDSYLVSTTPASGGSWTGGDIAEKFFGGDGPDEARGLGGNDELHGGGGADTLYGGVGDDVLHGEKGNDTLYGEDGNDILWSSPIYGGYVDGASGQLYGGAGNDTIYGSDGADTIDGGDGDDTIDAYWLNGKANDVISGGAGNDIIQAARSVVDGGAGADTIIISYNGSTLTGGAGADLFRFYLLSPPHAEVPAYQNPNLIKDFSIAQGDKLEIQANTGGFWPLAFYGAVDNPAFSLTPGTKFSVTGAEYGAGLKQVWTWQNAGFTYLIIDDNADGALDSYDSVLKFEGAVTLSAAAFIDVMMAKVGSATNGADVIQGTSGFDYLYGLGGADQLHGAAGDDEIWGHSGGDQIWGDEGQDKLYGGPGDDVLDGGAGDDYIQGNAGGDTIYGGDGNDQIFVAGYIQSDQGASDTADTVNIVYGGAGNDSISGSQPGSPGSGASLHDQLNGGDGNDTIFGNGVLHGDAGNDYVQGGGDLYGDAGNDSVLAVGVATLHGGDGDDFLTVRTEAWLNIVSVGVLYGDAGQDKLYGGNIADVLVGGSENDTLDGGSGLDTAVYSGAASAYSWSRAADGAWVVKDLRAGGADGQDTLKNVEKLQFADKTISLPQVFVDAILRGGLGATVADLEAKLTSGALDLEGAINATIRGAGATTSVATLAYQFFTGKVPGSGGIDYLVSPTGSNPNNLNSAYYQSFNLENRYINFAVNLGKIGEGNTKFSAEYGSLSLFDATKKAYTAIFGGTPTDAKVTALLSGGRDAYFAAYGGDGTNGIGTKAAMVGWLLAEAQKADLGVMVRSNDAWLQDLADGSAPFAIDILDPAKGYYKTDFIFGGQ